jgi:hypothetical protein
MSFKFLRGGSIVSVRIVSNNRNFLAMSKFYAAEPSTNDFAQ